MREKPELTEEQANELIEELAVALDALRRTTCVEMVALWSIATRKERRVLGSHAIRDLGLEPSPRYVGLSKGVRSRYSALAAWRHAVIWRGVLAQIGDHAFREAVRAMYFTPFPSNDPPYAWSARASEHPDVERFENATTMKNRAKEGCWHALNALVKERKRIEVIDFPHEVRAILLTPAVNRTLRDALKLEDLPELESP